MTNKNCLYRFLYRCKEIKISLLIKTNNKMVFFNLCQYF